MYCYLANLLEEIRALGVVWQDAVLSKKIKEVVDYVDDYLALPQGCGDIVDTYYVIEVNEG